MTTRPRGRGRRAVRPAPAPVQGARWPPTTSGSARSASASGRCAGRRVLDLGCGKGRFAAHAGGRRGPRWSGSTSRPRCWPRLEGLRPRPGLGAAAPVRRRRRSTRWSRSRSSSTWPTSTRSSARPAGCSGPAGSWRSSTRTPASLNAQRPWLPNLAVKWIDERAGSGCTRAAARSASAGSGPRGSGDRLGRRLRGRPGRAPALARGSGPPALPVRRRARLMTLWSARVPGGRLVHQVLVHRTLPLCRSCSGRRRPAWS